MPQVVSICLTPAGVERKPADRYARVAVAEAVLAEGHGTAPRCCSRSDRGRTGLVPLLPVLQLDPALEERLPEDVLDLPVDRPQVVLRPLADGGEHLRVQP